MKQTNFTSLVSNRRAPIMQRLRQCAGAAIIALAAGALSGCMLRGAPSFVVAGAFFPAWMLLAGIGILAAVGARAALLATGLSEILPLQLLVCVSAGLVIAILAWLLWFAI